MTECFPRCKMGLCKVKDTLSLARLTGKVTVSRRQITLHLSPGYISLSRELGIGAEGATDPPFLRCFRTCIIHIHHLSTRRPLTTGPGRGENQTDPLYFQSCPLRHRSRYYLSSYCYESTLVFHLKWFPASLATNHLFSKCDIFPV